MSCIIWRHITQHPHQSNHTAAGRPATFKYVISAGNRLKVDGIGGSGRKYVFFVDYDQFFLICQRFFTGLASGKSYQTSFYTDPKWLNPPCGRINTPAVVPVIQDLYKILNGKKAGVGCLNNCCSNDGA